MRTNKFGTLLTIAALVATATINAHDQIPGAKQSRAILLKGGDLYTISSGVMTATDLLFENGMISQIGKNITAPANAEIIDVTGRHVYPGLIAPNTNLGLIEIGAVRATNDLAEVGANTPEVCAYIAYNPDSELLPTVRSNGVTTVQVMPEGSALNGRTCIMNLDGWTVEDAGVKLVDGMFMQWPSVSVQTSWWVTKSAEDQKKDMAEARVRMRQLFDDARAYWLSKKANPKTKLDLRWEAMIPILSKEQPLYIAANDYRQIVEAVAFVKERDLRMILLGGNEAYKTLDLLKSNHIPVILGQTTSLPMRQDDDYDIKFKLPRILQDAGVQYCLGHFSTWDSRNLAFQGGQAVAFGLAKEDALRALTLSTAEILGIDKEQGSLSVGKKATLIVSEGDIMDVLGQKVTHMWIEGRAIDLNDRHKELYEKYQQKHFVPTAQ